METAPSILTRHVERERDIILGIVKVITNKASD